MIRILETWSMKWIAYVACSICVIEERHIKYFSGKVESKERVRSFDVCI
jgi:hypothetical protein